MIKNKIIQNFETILKILKTEVKNYNVPFVEFVKIQSNDPFKILISAILSARTKDELTAKICKNLFTKIKNFNDLENIEENELEKLIYPIGFYKTKAKNLKKLTIIIKNEFNNAIPDTLENLLKLPGVGRKTANLVISSAFNKDGICVDTHVHRITNRIGIIKTKTPYETEISLKEKIDKKYWKDINKIFVPFGQNICRPINPKCNICKINYLCNKIIVKTKNNFKL